MKQNIDAIRGDLNQFKKLVNAVEFAIESIDGHNAREARKKELDKQLRQGDDDLIKTKNEITTAKSSLKKTQDTAAFVVQKAQDQATNIIAQAKEAANKLTSDAENEVSALRGTKKTLAAEIVTLNSTLVKLQGQKTSAETELGKITNSMESALSRVKQ